LDVHIRFASNHTFPLLEKLEADNIRLELGGGLQVKRKYILAALVGTLALVLSGCGTSDKVSSLTISASGGTGFFDVKGEGGTLQLAVTANYTSGKIVDVTNWAVYTAVPLGTDESGTPLPSPPQTFTISTTGLATAVPPFVCSFHDIAVGATTTPSWVLLGSYQVTATYKGFTSQPAFIGIASAAGDAPNGSCGP
jgi:hypothetical protein